MGRGGAGVRKGGEKECKVCSSDAHAEIDAMILNGANYTAIINRHRELCPTEPALTKPNLTNHKKAHLLTQPITRVVQGEDGETEIQTYLTGQYDATNIVIPQSAVPEIPNGLDGLKIIIAAGLHNILNNPAIVTPTTTFAAIQELLKRGGGADDLDKYMGAWDAVAAKKAQMTKTAKRKRTVTVEDEVTLPAEAPAAPTIEGEWSESDLDSLALPAPGETE